MASNNFKRGFFFQKMRASLDKKKEKKNKTGESGFVFERFNPKQLVESFIRFLLLYLNVAVKKGENRREDEGAPRTGSQCQQGNPVSN